MDDVKTCLIQRTFIFLAIWEITCLEADQLQGRIQEFSIEGAPSHRHCRLDAHTNSGAALQKYTESGAALQKCAPSKSAPGPMGLEL